jgi:glycosyltransferase involved in cell wall biosynthesis
MLSVIIPTHNSERPLVPTLAALVPGATDGLIVEVLLADGGSQDETAAVADVAGCDFRVIEGGLGHRLKSAAEAARGSWLLFLRPGIVLDTPWTSEVGRFVQHPILQAAVFRRGTPSQSALREFLLLLGSAMGALPRPEQGLLISKEFYQALGGHSERSSDPDYQLMRRIGRSRSARLSTSAYVA